MNDNLNHLDWSYKGEGACNIVCYYTGKFNDYLTGKVLRLKKKVNNNNQNQNDNQQQEQEDKDYNFVSKVMVPLLGEKYVYCGDRIRLTKEFIDKLDQRILSSRPQHRVHHRLDYDSSHAILIKDISVIPNTLDSICVEIKPKCGFITNSKYISIENQNFKYNLCRYCIYQYLKLKQGSIEKISKYCPIDLFSLDKSRQIKSIQGLIECPQNNLKVFKNGQLIYTGQLGGGNLESSNIQSLNSIFNNQQKDLVEKLVDILQKENQLLTNLLNVQKYDEYDIETIYYLYCKLNGIMMDDTTKMVGDLSRFDDLSNLTNDQIQSILDRFLISTTSKDCSIMITFSNDQYIIGVVDLDTKKQSSIPQYYKLDLNILSTYQNEIKSIDNHHICNKI